MKQIEEKKEFPFIKIWKKMSKKMKIVIAVLALVVLAAGGLEIYSLVLQNNMGEDTESAYAGISAEDNEGDDQKNNGGMDMDTSELITQKYESGSKADMLAEAQRDTGDLETGSTLDSVTQAASSTSASDEEDAEKEAKRARAKENMKTVARAAYQAGSSTDWVGIYNQVHADDSYASGATTAPTAGTDTAAGTDASAAAGDAASAISGAVEQAQSGAQSNE